MNLKNKSLVLTILAIVTVIMLTSAITYAFFNYAKEGTTDNNITTGTITFLYTETSSVRRGISIEDAYPISDNVGKVQTGEGKIFDFKVTSNTPNKTTINYEVTARKKDTSTVPEEAVKLYLTKVEGDSEEEVILSKYSELTTTDKVDNSRYNEKTLYQGKVPANTTNYEQAFRLRMWIDEETDFSDGSMNDKEFTVTVNVYANAKVVSADEEELLASTDITSVEVDGKVATEGTSAGYDYEVELDNGKDSALVRVTTLNEYANVEVEKIDSVAYRNNVKRLSVSKTVDLVSGDNYFKITVTSENKEVTKEYKLKVVVPKDTINTLSSLSVTNCPLNEEFSSETTSYTCTTEYTKVTVSATTTSIKASIEGLEEKELVEGNNTITITVTSESGLEKVYTIIVTKHIKAVLLKDAIFSKYTTIYDNPNLTTTSLEAEENGLYVSNATNSEEPTYYFRGNVDNYLDFAGFTWRIVRINEDGTIRLIMQDAINEKLYKFSTNCGNKTCMYYSNSDTAKPTLETWYSDNIASNVKYSNRVEIGEYYCEQAKVSTSSTYVKDSGADMIVYTDYKDPNFKCEEDANGYGLINANVGLLSYDEALHAGAYYDTENKSYYLYNDSAASAGIRQFWTMSPSGTSGSNIKVWTITGDTCSFAGVTVQSTRTLRPVLNLKPDTTVTGLGTSDSHWKVAN